jgi:putative PEP-CTERM system histidine kinase
MPVATILLAACAVVYALISLWIAVLRSRAPARLLAACCLVTAGWAAQGALSDTSTPGIDGAADLVRALAWFGFVFFLYHDAKLGRTKDEIGFAAAGIAAAIAGAIAVVISEPAAPFAVSLFSLGIMARLGLAVAELLLIENLYLNLPDHARWHVALPSVLLGGLACFDILLCADIVLFHEASTALVGARTLGMIMIAPLLAVAASRTWRQVGKVRLSRTAVFHSATLVLSGSVLLALGLMGEVFRQVGGNWGWLVELSLGFAAMIALGLMLTSGSARSRFQRLFVDHFFAERYDYRRQWLACIRTLSGDDGDLQSSLAIRAIRTIVSVLDSPGGILFLRDGGGRPFNWAGSWNMPAAEALPAGHPVVAAVREGGWIARLDMPDGAASLAAPLDGVGPVWLAIPMVHRGVLTGLVLTAPPRAPFALEQEVFDLLRIVTQEVATYFAEQQATQTLLQTRHLHDYSKRFAFVAHDIKNVSSQLALLLTNAESHIANPEFQKDMLDTVRSSVAKITSLLQRLERPEADRVPSALAPLPRLEALVATYQRVRRAKLVLEHDGSTGIVSMGAGAFETVVTHLLNNAVEASPGLPVVLRVRHEARQVVIDIVDAGPGMTPEFVRDELFQPFSTSKQGGTGIGAFQSRELAREAGGELEVISRPGAGATMRLLLPRIDSPPIAAASGAVAAAASDAPRAFTGVGA